MKAGKLAEVIVPDDGDRLMDTKETAARLLTSHQTITGLARNGYLHAVKIGRNLGYSKRAVDRLIKRLSETGEDMLVLAGMK